MAPDRAPPKQTVYLIQFFEIIFRRCDENRSLRVFLHVMIKLTLKTTLQICKEDWARTVGHS
jgi:hypothetical protein